MDGEYAVYGEDSREKRPGKRPIIVLTVLTIIIVAAAICDFLGRVRKALYKSNKFWYIK